MTTPDMQLPPPAVFHDKAKRTQQGNLLGMSTLLGCTGNTLSKISVHIAYVSEIGCLLICLGLPNWVRLFLVSPNWNISPAVMLHKIQRHNFFPSNAMDWLIVPAHCNFRYGIP